MENGWLNGELDSHHCPSISVFVPLPLCCFSLSAHTSVAVRLLCRRVLICRGDNRTAPPPSPRCTYTFQVERHTWLRPRCRLLLLLPRPWRQTGRQTAPYRRRRSGVGSGLPSSRRFLKYIHTPHADALLLLLGGELSLEDSGGEAEGCAHTAAFCPALLLQSHILLWLQLRMLNGPHMGPGS